ncbi:MAG: ABC transporter permease [Bacteroidales bacterium]|nr:MAG: ABC transporter permease [Bacteroidales bacterium]
MTGHIFKIAIRNLKKNKTGSIINLVGLTLGILTSVLIILGIRFELNYDRHNVHYDRIYRVNMRFNFGVQEIDQVVTPPYLGPAMVNDFPQVKNAVRIVNVGATVSFREKKFREDRAFAADSSLFQIFSFRFIEGNPATVFGIPNTAVITESVAGKYFGNENPVGEILNIKFDGGTDSTLYLVTGVIGDLPASSHFHFDIVVSLESFSSWVNRSNWYNNAFKTYILLEENASVEGLTEKLPEFTYKYWGDTENFDAWLQKENRRIFYLYPLSRIHLYSDLSYEFEANGNILHVRIFAIVATLILIIVCINFMNLVTARSSGRLTEIGIKKVIGATRQQLILQFISEAVLMCLVSLVFGMVILEFILPYAERFLNINLRIHYFEYPLLIPSLFGLALMVGLLSGAYPALYLSSFRPIRILQANVHEGRGQSSIRRILVVFQYFIATILLSFTMIVFMQFQLLKKGDLGFNDQGILVIYNPNTLENNLKSFRTRINGIPEISSNTLSHSLPGTSFPSIGFQAEGSPDLVALNINQCDEDFIQTLDIELVEGRSFHRDYATDTASIIINQEAARIMDLDNPLGKILFSGPDLVNRFTIIGVVKDFHYASKQHAIEPMALVHLKNVYREIPRYLTLKTSTARSNETIGRIETIWNEFLPSVPFRYSFLDEEYAMLFKKEKQLGRLMLLFSLFAILFASMGLFGLTAYSINQKGQEIGIRKAYGASGDQILWLFTVHTTKWVLTGNLLSIPIIFVLIGKWLTGYASRVDLSAWYIIVPIGITLGVSWITVGYLLRKAANTNPGEILRYE